MARFDKETQAAFDTLQTQLASAIEKIERLEEHIEVLTAENEELRRLAGMNSSNSSKPPSSDPPGAVSGKEKQKKKKKKRKRGGQKGHRGHQRSLLPPERVDHVVDVTPDDCKACGDGLVGKELDPHIQQMLELVDGKIEVTEYRFYLRQCGCGAKTRGQLPDPVLPFLLGPRLTAVVALLTGKYRLSKRNTRQLLVDLFDVEISIGTISAAEKRMSEALAKPVREAEEFIREQDIVHVDFYQ